MIPPIILRIDDIGKRLLIRESIDQGCIEVTLLELSPSGKRMKLQFESGNTLWVEAGEYTIVEVLPARTKKGRTPKKPKTKATRKQKTMKPSTIELYRSIKARFAEITKQAEKEGRKVKVKEIHAQIAREMNLGTETVRRATM